MQNSPFGETAATETPQCKYMAAVTAAKIKMKKYRRDQDESNSASTNDKSHLFETVKMKEVFSDDVDGRHHGSPIESVSKESSTVEERKKTVEDQI